jgi:hypothetical protein
MQGSDDNSATRRQAPGVDDRTVLHPSALLPGTVGASCFAFGSTGAKRQRAACARISAEVRMERSVDEFLRDSDREDDCRALVAMMERVTGEPARMWGKSIVGFGSYHYRYESGHEGDTCLTGFSPRKSALTLYLMPDFEAATKKELEKLGKHKSGKGCLYVKRLADVDAKVLEQIVRKSVTTVRARS